MNDSLVEVYFEGAYSPEKYNILTKEKFDLLQAICSRPIEIKQMSKRHKDEKRISFWDSEDVDHPDFKILYDEYYIGGQANIVPLHRLIALDLPIEYKIKHTIKEIPEYNIEETVLHKLISLDEKLKKFDQVAQFNTKVGVHISDLGLLSVREVDWMEDACTEELQRKLDDGWRILAVCPQPNSRRPDYVLGRNRDDC